MPKRGCVPGGHTPPRCDVHKDEGRSLRSPEPPKNQGVPWFSAVNDNEAHSRSRAPLKVRSQNWNEQTDAIA